MWTVKALTDILVLGVVLTLTNGSKNLAVAQTNVAACSFNQNKEACTVNLWANGSGSEYNIAVTWLSDGKQTFYAFDNRTVSIIEDNGRPTSGRWYRQGGNLVVKSSRGNTTVIPWY